MNNEIQINVENYLLEQLPPIDRDNKAEFLSAMGVSKYRDSYQLEHNTFARFFKNYVVVVFQNNRSDLAIYNFEKNVYEVNYVDVILGKIIKYFLNYAELLWNPQWEDIIVKTLKRDTNKIINNFDDGDYINLKDGLFNLETFKLIPHSPKHYTTIQLPISFGENVETKIFNKFLDDITCGDKELQQLLQEIMGYCLCNNTKAEKAFFFIGNGCNGKSVLAKVIQEMVGSGNYSNTPLSALGGNFGLASLMSSNVNIAAENSNGKINSETFKAVVSGDTVEINRKYKDAISAALHTKLIFLFNELPDNSDLTYGFFRKIIILPFNRTFKGEEIDVEMFDKLKTEISGIFQWSIEGLKRLSNNNYVFSNCSISSECLENYKRDLNPVAIFFETNFNINDTKQIKRSDIYACYQEYCFKNSYDVLQCQKFWRCLKAYWNEREYNFKTKKIKGYEYFVGFDFN